MKTLTPEEIGWIAGFFDGEGTFNVYHNEEENEWVINLTISQNDESVIRHLQEVFECGTVYQRDKNFRLQVNGAKNVYEILVHITPLLRTKRYYQANIVLELCRLSFMGTAVRSFPERQELRRKFREMKEQLFVELKQSRPQELKVAPVEIKT